MSDGRRLRESSVGRRLAFLVNDSILYGGASAVTKLVGLFTVPILTRAFATEEYGAVDAIAVLGAVFVGLATMGQDAAATRFYYESEDPRERRAIVSQALATQVVLAVLVAGGVLLTARWWVTRVISAEAHLGAFRWLVASLPAALVFQFCRGLLRWTFARWACVMISVFSTLLIVALTLVLVIVGRQGVAGVFQAQLAGLIVSAAAGAWLCRQHLTWRPGTDRMLPMLRYGWPYMFMAVIAFMLPALDRVFVTRWLGLEQMGVYALGAKVVMLLQLPIMAFQSAWGPFSLAIYKEADAEATYNRALAYYALGMSIVILALVLVAEPIVTLFAPVRYIGAVKVVLPLAFGLVIESVAWVTGIGIDLSKRTYFAAAGYLAGLVATALAMWILVGPLGLIGVAYGTLIGRIVQALVYTWGAYHAYPLRFAWASPVLALALAFAFGILGSMAPMTHAVIAWAIRAALLGCLALVLWRFFVSATDRALVRYLCRTWVRPHAV